MNKDLKKTVNNDVEEERSVFITGISSVATEEMIKSKLSNFGEVKNVKFVTDRDTGIFKNTGFVEFKTQDAAAKCIANNEDPAYKNSFMIDGQIMKCRKALSKKDVKRADLLDPRKKIKDTRNIYLAREGVIRADTQAAEDVSKFDLSVRIQREKLKHKLLANLHCFVSPTRMFFCNIPEQISDVDIKKIFKENSPKEAVITECKIMRDSRDIGDDGRPKSKGFGFINFVEHIHALAALRAVNNNPLIFTKNRRPIVEFSIENKAALNAKQRRQQKSKDNVNKQPKQNPQHVPGSDKKEIAPVTLNNSKFVGGKAKQGMKLASHFGPRAGKKSGKITRNTINNKARKERKRQKQRIVKDKKKPKTTNKKSPKQRAKPNRKISK